MGDILRDLEQRVQLLLHQITVIQAEEQHDDRISNAIRDETEEMQSHLWS